MLEWLLGLIANQLHLCARVQIPLFPMFKYHLYEALWRFFFFFVSLIVSFLILFLFVEDIIYWLFNVALIYNDPFLILVNKVHVSFIISIQLNFIFFVYNIYLYFCHGLKKEENDNLKKFLKSYSFLYFFIFINILLLYYFFIIQFSYFEHLYYNINYLIKTLKIFVYLNIFLPLINAKNLNYIFFYFLIINILGSFFFYYLDILFLFIYIFFILEIFKYIRI